MTKGTSRSDLVAWRDQASIVGRERLRPELIRLYLTAHIRRSGPVSAFCHAGTEIETIIPTVLQGFVKGAPRCHNSLGSRIGDRYISRRWRRGGREPHRRRGKAYRPGSAQGTAIRGHGPGHAATISGAKGGQPSRGRVVLAVRRRKAARQGSPRRRKARQCAVVRACKFVPGVGRKPEPGAAPGREVPPARARLLSVIWMAGRATR
jgi:hypothetical protein